MKPKPAVTDSGFGNYTFLRTGAAGAFLTTAKRASAELPSDALNVALVGCGNMGETIVRATRSSLVPIRWVAFCDILESKPKSFGNKQDHLREANNQSWSYRHLESMLKEHPEIDAVFIATPDWLHEPMTTLCLRAGKHVYCEKTMATTVEGAANMVRAQRETGKLLQIGYQRRSNPIYQRCHEDLVHRLKICGRMTHAYSQYNHGVNVPIRARYTEKQMEAISAAGYAGVFEFLNWRHFKKYGPGEFVNLGGMQVDVLNWFFNTPPSSVMATGGLDYYKDVALGDKERFSYEHFDNVTAIFDYDVPENGLVRALCGVQTTNSHQWNYEKLMGVNATITIAENRGSWDDDLYLYNRVYREAWDTDLRKWDEQYFTQGYLKKGLDRIHHKFWERDKTWYEMRKTFRLEEDQMVVGPSQPLEEYFMPWFLNKPYHTPHIENFLETVYSGGKQSDLNCPAEEAYKTTVAVLKAREIAETKSGKYVFKPEDFVVV